MATLIKNDNPYVGPRTFRPDERGKFYGRVREARDLTALIVSNRLVLFYAPSGAGKSSLLNTMVGPALVEAGFELLPTGRVSGYSGDEVDVDNIYTYNLMLSLHEASDAKLNLESVTLLEFLDNLIRQDDGSYAYSPDYSYPADTIFKPRVLIIDQFEELVTTNVAQWVQRHDFFAQMSAAMQQDDQLWVVLTMREDFVARFDPYLHLTPNRLRHRYHMERLERAAALDAICSPAAAAGRPFDDSAAAQLVDNLRRIRSTDGQGVERLDQFVEPVQLQAVCYQMWQKLRNLPGETITEANVTQFADVDTALINFYEETIDATVAENKVSEIDLRAWFDRELITEAGTRNMVFRGVETTGDLPTQVADYVRSQFILREVVRPGGTWYELVHDSFVSPILAANATWRQEQPLIRLAQRWDEAKRPNDLLLSGQQLDQLVNSEWQALGPLVAEFVAAGRKFQKDLEDRDAAEKSAQQARELEQAEAANAKQRRLMYLASFFAIIAVVLALIMLSNASEQANRALMVAANEESLRITSEANAQIARNAERIAREASNMALAEAANAESLRKTSEANAQIAQGALATHRANLIAQESATAPSSGALEPTIIGTPQIDSRATEIAQIDLTATAIAASQIVTGSTRTSPKDGMTLNYVPAGTFLMGRVGSFNEQPVHEVTMDSFWIDHTEVTNEQFASFLNEEGNQQEGGGPWIDLRTSNIEQQDGSFQAKSDNADHPVIRVSWFGARAYCEWVGGQLPTEAQWEYAARGTESNIYPWGDVFNGNKVNFCDRSCRFEDRRNSTYDDGEARTAIVGSYPEGASWVGALDMAGNVWEWVNDWFGYYQDVPTENPEGPRNGDTKITRGGSWFSRQNTVNAVYRSNHKDPSIAEVGATDIGFRCVRE